MFNEQQLSMSMTQEKAKQYIKEINNWLNEMGTLETTTSSFDLTYNSDKLLTKSFSLLSLDEAYNAYANAISTCVDDEEALQAAANEILLNSNSLNEQDYNLTVKKENLINSIQYLNTQLITLRDMFEKRQDQLRNSRFLNKFKPIQRVEQVSKQFCSLSDDEETQEEVLSEESSIKEETLFSDLNLNDIQKNDNKNSIIKRDSMNKVFRKLILNKNYCFCL